MSFTGENSGMELGKAPCAPDYEKQAANAKVTMEKKVKFVESFTEFINDNSLHSYRDIKSVIEFYGAVVYEMNQSQLTYQRLLKNLEEEK